MGGVLVSRGGDPGVSPGRVGGDVSAGQLGIGLVGWRSPVSVVAPRYVCDWGKKVIRAFDIWHTSLMAGPRMPCTRPMFRNCVFPSALAVRTSSTGHLAGVRLWASPFHWLCVGTNRMCPVGIRMRVSLLAWLRIATDCQGVSSHTGRTIIVKNGVVVFVKDASACRTTGLMLYGLYSGFSMHDLVHM